MDTVSCPRCGTENLADALNCGACRINLRFALENPAEIERLVQEDIRRGELEGDLSGNHAILMSEVKDDSVLLPVLLLFTSFIFAFCIGEAVHELGHFLTHRAYGYQVGIILDPFGGSRTLGSSSPKEIWGITSLMGPLFNLPVAITLSLFLWQKRQPGLLPFLLWGPIALIQEGVTFSLGLLTPGGDAALVVDWGVPSPVILSLGILFLASGVAMVCLELPLLNLSPKDSFSRRFIVVIGGMVSFMVVRLLYTIFSSPNLAQENVVPLIFSLLLATIVVLLYDPLHSVLNRISFGEPVIVGWRAVLSSAALGIGMILVQFVFFN